MLHRHGLVIGRNRVRRHMRNLNLIHTGRKGHRKKVPRTVVVSRPNIMWETDITKVYIDHEGWVYLTAYVDLCSRKIKGYLVSRMSRTREMIEAFNNAILNTFPDLNASGLIIRSDNGSQLTSHNYLTPTQYYMGNPEEILRIRESKIERARILRRERNMKERQGGETAETIS